MSKEKDMRRLIDSAKKLGFADSEILKAIADGNLEQLVLKEVGVEAKFSCEDTPDYFKEVTVVLNEIGVPVNLMGYNYLRTAIIMCVKNQGKVLSITKVLYPAIAEEYGTTISRAERAIRHAIEVAFERAPEELYSYFKTVSLSKGKVTNSEFIAKISEEIRMRHR